MMMHVVLGILQVTLVPLRRVYVNMKSKHVDYFWLLFARAHVVFLILMWSRMYTLDIYACNSIKKLKWKELK